MMKLLCKDRYKNNPQGLEFQAGPIMVDDPLVPYLLKDAPENFQIMDLNVPAVKPEVLLQIRAALRISPVERDKDPAELAKRIQEHPVFIGDDVPEEEVKAKEEATEVPDGYVLIESLKVAQLDQLADALGVEVSGNKAQKTAILVDAVGELWVPNEEVLGD